MPCCEKCWVDAYYKHIITGKSQADCYIELLKERQNNPCTSVEQAGDWWDEEKQCDSRITPTASGQCPPCDKNKHDQTN